MSIGLDYSAGRIPGVAIRAAGIRFVLRYAGTPGRTKNITKPEYADLVGAGVQVLLVHENTINDIQGGFPGGVGAAHAARADADAIGYPPGGVIFFCADRHLSATEIPIGLAYIRGAASVLGQDAVGAYGFSEFVDAVKATGAARWIWQCGSRSTVGPAVHLYQRNTGTTRVNGIDCDINDLLLPINFPIRHNQEEDTMFIAMGPLPESRLALLSGGVFRELSDGEKATAQDAIRRQGAVEFYVEPATWDFLQAASAALCGLP